MAFSSCAELGLICWDTYRASGRYIRKHEIPALYVFWTICSICCSLHKAQHKEDALSQIYSSHEHNFLKIWEITLSTAWNLTKWNVPEHWDRFCFSSGLPCQRGYSEHFCLWKMHDKGLVWLHLINKYVTYMTLSEANIPPRLDNTSQHLANSYHGYQQCRYEIINRSDWCQRYPWQNWKIHSLENEEIAQYLTQYIQIFLRAFHYYNNSIYCLEVC